MKKNLLWLGMLLLVLVGCSSSDDEIGILDQNILGTWQHENAATMDKDYRSGLIFASNGEIKSWGYGTTFDGGSAYKEEHFGYFWFDSDGELHIKAQSKEPIPDELYYKVTRLTSTQLVIRMYGGIMNTPFDKGTDLVYKKVSLD